jgi:large subunit ribosomal protein L3
MNESMGLLGRKVGMTQLFNADGTVLPVTVVELGPCTVLQVKTKASKDGYDAIQLGYGTKKEHRANKPEKGLAAKANTQPAQQVGEIRLPDASGYSRGQVLTTADVFASGQKVDIVGTSKGRGFGGVMKSHHFAGFERSHGAHEYFRHGGSIGTRLTPGMTLKGKKMPGQLGNARVTVQNVEIAKVDTDRNLLFLHGTVPGPNGGYITVRTCVKNIK